MLAIRGILHPTDFSEAAHLAFPVACHLAQDYRAPLYVVHVSTGLETFHGENISNEHSAQYLIKEWQQLEAFQFPGIEIHRSLEEGEPSERILHVASRFPIDLIVMGTHGTSALTRLLVGSVTDQVVRHAACAVLVVKHPIPTTEDASPP